MTAKELISLSDRSVREPSGLNQQNTMLDRPEQEDEVCWSGGLNFTLVLSNASGILAFKKSHPFGLPFLYIGQRQNEVHS